MADKYNTADRKRMAGNGQAMSDGSYPIADEEDLHNAIHAVGRGGGSHDAIRAHIIKRAKALGLSSAIPDNWGSGGSMNGSPDSRSARPVERRLTKADVHIVLRGGAEERDANTPQRIGGYAARYNDYSRDLGHFVEQIDPACFRRCQGRGWPDVICRFNHNDSDLLGTISGGTLDLASDRDGLLYDVEPPASMSKVVDWVRRGDVSKSSFAFRKVTDDWSMTSDGSTLRTVYEAQLVDVAPVVTPAYDTTSVNMRYFDDSAGLRSLAEHFDADYEEVRSLADQFELRRFFVRTDTDGGAQPRKTMYPAQALAMLNARRANPAE